MEVLKLCVVQVFKPAPRTYHCWLRSSRCLVAQMQRPVNDLEPRCVETQQCLETKRRCTRGLSA